MIARRLQSQLLALVEEYPAVALLGPRQVGKTTLALEMAEALKPAIYLDLESAADRAKLADPELYLTDHEDKLVILDEVHRVPEMFQSLRGLIDKGRRKGRRTRRFLLLGSASMDLLQQSGESLAGRIAKGFYHACEDIGPEAKFVVCSGTERFPVSDGVEAIHVRDLTHELAALR